MYSISNISKTPGSSLVLPRLAISFSLNPPHDLTDSVIKAKKTAKGPTYPERGKLITSSRSSWLKVSLCFGSVGPGGWDGPGCPLIWRPAAINHDVLISCKHERADQAKCPGLGDDTDNVDIGMDEGCHCSAFMMDAFVSRVGGA